MFKKKKSGIKFRFVCETCKKEVQPDPQQSNKNWEVFSTTCSCGGHIKMEFDKGEGEPA